MYRIFTYQNLLSMAYVPPMFFSMGTLDHAIGDLILVRLRRPGLSGRRFGVDVLGDPGFTASLMRGA